MRILIANGRFFHSSGPEHYLFALMSLLESAGHAVVPFAVNYPQTIPTPYADNFLPPATPDGKLLFESYRHDLTLFHKIRMFARATYSLEARRRVASLLRDHEIDILLLLNIVNTISPSIIHAAKSVGIPVVMRLSDFNLSCPAYSFLRNGDFCQACKRSLLYAVKYRCLQNSRLVSLSRVLAMSVHRALRVHHAVDLFLCPSTLMRQEIIDLGYSPQRAIFLPTFASDIPPDYNPRHRQHFLYFGRLSPEKGVHLLVRAYSRTSQEIPLLIAGDMNTSYAHGLQELAREHNAHGVRFVGFQTGDDLKALIHHAHATIHPAIWPENGPNAVIESLALGTPVIAASVPGILDYVTPQCSLLVPSQDVDTLSRLLQQCMDNPALLEPLGPAAHDHASHFLRPERHLESLLSLFRKLLASRSSPSTPAPA